MKKPMTYQQAVKAFQCTACRSADIDEACTCVLSSTCSFKCKTCGMSNYFQGDLDDAPANFLCVGCSSKIINKFRREGK
jgi:DNA-directed RNA polymerase subunit RPC12/RpoP